MGCNWDMCDCYFRGNLRLGAFTVRKYKLSTIIKKVIKEISQSSARFAVVKTEDEDDPKKPVYALLMAHKSKGRYNVAIQMQDGYMPVLYPDKAEWELVGVEIHHPVNDVFKKYIHI